MPGAQPGAAILGCVILHHLFADTPAAWPQAPTVSVLQFVLVLLIAPVAVGSVISLFVVMPSLAHRKSHDPDSTGEGPTDRS